MGDVAGVDHERRFYRQRLDSVDGFFVSAGRIGIGRLSKPTWLSLICRNVRFPAFCAIASSMMPSERGTPPDIVHRTPVPAQVLHSRILRRLTPSLAFSLSWSWS